MLGDIQKWIPFIVFLGGASLGLLLYYLYLFIRRNNKSTSKQKSSVDKEFLRKKFLETQLIEQENQKLRSEINAIYEKLNKLKQSSEQLAPQPLKSSSELEDLKLENEYLKRKIKKLKKINKQEKEAVRESNTYLTKYKNFLNDLDQAIGKAREEADFKEENAIQGKENKSSENVDDKFAHYREKFKSTTGKSDFTAKLLNELQEEEEEEEDYEYEARITTENLELTKLYGITPEINMLLNDHDIITLEDLSKTKIADLRNILETQGEKFKNVDPLNWPLQARLAQKGHWDVIKEYTEKMNKRTP